MKHVSRVIHGKANEYSKKKYNTKPEEAISSEWDYHSLRHTHATILLEAGVPLPLIQERLGHIDVEITQRYTNHVTQSMTDSFNKNIDNLFK